MDIREDFCAVSALNAILSNKNIAEVKIEHGKIAVVEIKRELKYPVREK